MQALSAPVFELNQESELYKNLKKRKDGQGRINEIIDDIAKENDFKSEEFRYYNSHRFGFERFSESYERHKEHLTKNADRNGLHTFKKSTKPYKDISSKMKEIDSINGLVSAFAHMDVFGFNNAKRTQWVKDRYFVEVRDGSKVDFNIATVIDYKEYLQVVMDHIE